ncbi:DUF3194 domain-containing protein [Candidatus Bathyarchaeota archaeon]|nr:DUF3194 domain-containing protein [Candidatus Bathyarchaeota archaeon]
MNSGSPRSRLKRRLKQEEIEEICEAAEDAARKTLFAELSQKQVSDFEIAVEATGDKPLTLTVDISASPGLSNRRLGRLIEEACDRAFEAAEQKAKELGVA